MKIPPYLVPGSTIGICAPARKVSSEEMVPGISLLENWGFKVKTAKNLYAADHQFSGTDAQRTADMQELMDDPMVDAIISARGGYGCVRIIDKLNFTKFEKKPKWIIGFSDLTVFHNHLHQNFSIPSVHAPMVFSMGGNRCTDEALENLRRLLTGEAIRYLVESSPFNRKGNADGILVGGNLSLLYALSGSESDIDTNGKILFIEDLDEYLYHIDRMMMQLKRSGKLDGLSGLIVGGMSDMRDNAIPFGKTAEEIISEAVRDYTFPVCMNFPSGHIQNNHPLVMGGSVSLEVGEKSIVEIKTFK
ncbi:MAG: LD-carboxypeptidase [Bacteroidetes bacterium]|nr:LD-carboxypeptidase [Bacteroidota bacterium]